MSNLAPLTEAIVKTDKEKSKEIIEILGNHWPAPNYAFIPELRSGTGFSREQRVDAIAMHLWPSKGLELIGFEIKVSRADWKRELKMPDKCEHVKQFCDRWYLVVYDLKVIKYAEELPTGWGLMFLENGIIHTMIEAPKLTPKPVDKLFVAALIRRASKVLLNNL